MNNKDRFGARVVNLPPNVLLIEQTKFSDKQGRYVIDHDDSGDKIERHVAANEDAAVAEAIRLAVAGQLTK